MRVCICSRERKRLDETKKEEERISTLFLYIYISFVIPYISSVNPTKASLYFEGH